MENNNKQQGGQGSVKTKTAEGVKTTFRGGAPTGPRGRRPGGARGKKPFVRAKQEFKEKVIDLRRVTRVMAGGKRFRFRTTIIIGDERGRVGVGTGKGVDVVQSIGKAKNDAKKNMIKVSLEKNTIPHEVEAKFSAARVLLKPAKEGNGLVAGGAVRTVLTLAGVKDITAKCLGGTTNKLTNAWATIEALKRIKPKTARVKFSNRWKPEVESE
ncbi:MAG: 30S ribosomal protein S5 [Candidatus Harrisonbacteria bacterium CG10_big_fil_rev_8_21_14_0_10_49_15]|uniref:Small ribosomal subunit protein uS5 n=1 Tax=Candidatus Harrisonbacteria bacterium CG10_big_fil_rev_8_21_14_0_10_49_15 TaxID=1974587 RepID=A0A2H0UKY5_9BACT|nr:MAG: 30S ribosomal protein S5 [Candidatus Harrisonbacteria bacterium CG10_big_fil_rev_8_21_14_0_10_49_15]